MKVVVVGVSGYVGGEIFCLLFGYLVYVDGWLRIGVLIVVISVGSMFGEYYLYLMLLVY